MSSTPTPPTDGPDLVRVGVAGWSYRDWEGVVYPTPEPRGFDRLQWIARFLDLIEINVSFYRVPAPRTSRSWVQRLEAYPRFRFTAKLPQEITHRQQLDADTVAEMAAFLAPLRAAGRLDALLAQFPWSFRPSERSLEWLERVRETFAQDQVEFEVRHGAWARDGWPDRLAAAALPLVNIDQPIIGDSLGPWTNPTTTFRLHGRNRAAWFDREAGRDERYNYLYASEELRPWLGRITAAATETTSVRVVTNNHFRGQAVANALEIKAGLGQPVPEIPNRLAQEHPSLLPRLAALGVTPRLVEPPHSSRAQGDLFG